MKNIREPNAKPSIGWQRKGFHRPTTMSSAMAEALLKSGSTRQLMHFQTVKVAERAFSIK